ncbi:MAG: TolB family protein [Planctomycetota bacterium]
MKRTLRLAMAGSMLVFGVASAQTTELVSLSSANTNVLGWCWYPSLSADANYVLFESESEFLVPGDTNKVHDVFVRDRANGQTTRVSVDSSGTEGTDNSFARGISADGRYVSFLSTASNLVPGDTNGMNDVFVHDRDTGQTTRVNVDSAGVQSNGAQNLSALSANGRYVAFESWATNLVAGDTNGFADIFVHDRETSQTTRVSVSSAGGEADRESRQPAISADGRFVAFRSAAANLVPPGTSSLDIYVHDRQTAQTTRISVDAGGGLANGGSVSPAISADGRHVSFASVATDLVPGDTNGEMDVFVRDRMTGQTTRVSVDSSGQQSNSMSMTSVLSADGRYVAFDTYAYNLVPGQPQGTQGVYVHDRLSGQTTHVSVSTSGTPSFQDAAQPSLSPDGRFVAFFSPSGNLVPGDFDTMSDIFLRDRGPERVTPFCASSIAACPCANVGAEHHGCATSIYPRGGYLGGYGTPSVAADTFLLQAQEVSGLTTLFYQGDAQMSPAVLDDGLACVSGSLVRLGVRSNVGAVSSYPQAGDLSVSVRGLLPLVGGTRYYQAWYRNALPFCTPATTNRTNGLVVVWAP